MSRSRAPLFLGLTAAGGVGYYLFQAGGQPKVAEKQFEADVHKASAKIRGELPGKGKQYEKEAEVYGKEAGAKFDNAVNKTEAELQKAKANAEAWGKETKAETLKKIDELDRKVETKAAEAKTGVSSWFGGK